MKKSNFQTGLLFFIFQYGLISCSGQNQHTKENSLTSSSGQTKKFNEGTDYLIFERVRMLDRQGFTEPQEAYSVLLPKGWQHEDEIIWNSPGSGCDGTFRKLKAASGDGRYSFEIYPDLLYLWNTNPELLQFYQNNPASSPYCGIGEPMDAENYFRHVFVAGELGNPQIIKVQPNEAVVQQMEQLNEESRREMQSYGAGQMTFYQTAINATVRWPDQTEGQVVLGVTVVETVVPNNYNGTYDKIYTSQVTKRTVFRYPASESIQAKNQFSVVMASFRSNPLWNDAVSKYWKDVRMQKHIAHIGTLQLMDEQTRRMGDAAIQAGNDRLKSMDADMRNWEARQSSLDRMHTNFIKTIREVENYRDETGKVELSSGYDHAWSRSDGNHFILTDNPNFDAASVFQDQNWKEMKKAD